MANEKHFIDGKQTLKEQEDALNFIEKIGFCKLLDYAKSTKTPNANIKANMATTQDVPIGQQPGDLNLVAVRPPKTSAQIVADQLAAGRGIIFHQLVFVESKEAEVFGFRPL